MKVTYGIVVEKNKPLPPLMEAAYGLVYELQNKNILNCFQGEDANNWLFQFVIDVDAFEKEEIIDME